MRAAYGQEQKAAEYLAGRRGISDVFLPRWLRERTYGRHRRRVLVSLIPNTLFVRSTRQVLGDYVGTPPLAYFHHYYQPDVDADGQAVGTGRKPIVIPDVQMTSFRRWVDTDAADKIYRRKAYDFQQNDLVRVREGDFAGFTGYVVRLKGQTRVGVNIEGVGFISTTYIPKNCLELVRPNT